MLFPLASTYILSEYHHFSKKNGWPNDDQSYNSSSNDRQFIIIIFIFQKLFPLKIHLQLQSKKIDKIKNKLMKSAVHPICDMIKFIFDLNSHMCVRAFVCVFDKSQTIAVIISFIFLLNIEQHNATKPQNGNTTITESQFWNSSIFHKYK